MGTRVKELKPQPFWLYMFVLCCYSVIYVCNTICLNESIAIWLQIPQAKNIASHYMWPNWLISKSRQHTAPGHEIDIIDKNTLTSLSFTFLVCRFFETINKTL